ncbi:MAG: phenylalanine--tRNA ligase subunit beta [Planctomycetaceae bacterium]
MLVNTTWLLDYLEPHCDHKELLETFTAAGLEVEDAHELSASLRDITIGFIREKKPIPDNDGLYACKIETAKNHLIDVVCASEHPVEVGWGVPVATAGTVLPSGAEIRESNYHGVKSQGMICLDGEMGLVARDSGLHVFNDESLLGRSLAEVIDIPEWLVDLAILPNRPDCLGMIGIAREIAAALGLKLKYPVSPTEILPMSTESIVPVHVENGELCPRYLGQVVRGVKVGPSPHWLKSRLLTAGKRPINNVVDITNFVLLEWGQPLHAFDLSTLNGPEIHVRNMQPGEQLELLDGTVIKGETNPLVIADATRPVALAGIMGGSETQTTIGTTDVLIEAACFDSVTIRRTAKQLGVTSDSSYRFERGTDPNRMLEGAITRATSLVQELAGGTSDGACTETHLQPRKPRVIPLSTEQFQRHLGMEVEASTIRSSLEKLEMTCTEDLEVTVPTWRVDVNDPVVLVEDVARLVGYDTIPLKPMTATATAGYIPPMDRLRNQVAETLAANGFLECRKAPLRPISDGNLTGESSTIQVQNPMREDMTTLRASLIPSLLETVEHNARRGAENFRFFEIDRTFRLIENEPDEQWCVALMFGGHVNHTNWTRHGEAVTFFHAKGIVENLLELAGVTNDKFLPANQSPGWQAAGQGAELFVNEKPAGILGQVNPKLLSKSKIRTQIFAAELNLQACLNDFSRIRLFQGLSRTPAITRDLAVVVPSDVQYAQLESTAHQAFASAAGKLQSAEGASESAENSPGPRLEHISCIDFYQGKQIAEGGKSLTIRLVFREPTRTLTSDEATQLTDAVIDALNTQHKVALRS